MLLLLLFVLTKPGQQLGGSSLQPHRLLLRLLWLRFYLLYRLLLLLLHHWQLLELWLLLLLLPLVLLVAVHAAELLATARHGALHERLQDVRVHLHDVGVTVDTGSNRAEQPAGQDVSSLIAGSSLCDSKPESPAY